MSKIVRKIRINLKKQSQFASRWLEIGSTKLEILNDLKKQSQFTNGQNERKISYNKGI